MKQDAEIVGGLNAVLAALKSRPKSCRSLMAAEGRHRNAALDEIYALARAHGLAVKMSPRQALDRVYGREGHQGLVALFDPLEYVGFEDFLETLPAEGPALVLALDQVEDPGNLGALMRSALAFGAAGVLTGRERSAALTPAAVHAAAGAAEVLPLVRVVNLRRALETLQERGFWLAGADGEAEGNLFRHQFAPRTVLALGSEGQGLSRIIKKTCDELLAIPQNRAQVSSLNVSVAGAVFMCEYFRQMQAAQA
ncbi:MAG: 23S rRNA (guanosine(2251)-2'-O)-methyltransferase RlmB [Candidatus Adiutrix sp.]|nr:23S rRNA (guanosine(2251)-2'-O)-methyltransferase RlmB [Candidatus Adiutrix sp.]